MKRKFMKSFATALFVASVSLSSVNHVEAKTLRLIEHKEDLNANVKFIGFDGDYVKFEVSYSKPSKSATQLRIYDQNGLELYSEALSTGYSKLIKVAISEVSRIDFIISGREFQLNKTFKILPQLVVNVVESK
ncbi:MAG: hypothetical protein ACO29O_00205 [Chitinophagaceae bacterium]